MKQFRIHRVNFFRPEPKEIKYISYDEHTRKLAIVRSNFTVEIWDMRSNPFLEQVIPSAADNSVESVVWYKGRLFSCNLQGQIIEYDLNLMCPKYCFHASPGALWCLAINEDKSLLAVGTEDGNVCILQITDEGVEFIQNLYKQKDRILCLAWHESGDVIVAGSINCIRVWNLTTGSSETITVGATVQEKDVIVWCVAVTSDKTIVSGDSCGRTSFWDLKTGTLISASSVHKGDVLTLCLNKDEDVVYSSGADPVIIMHVKSKTATTGRREKWMKSTQRILHTHDVKALQLAGDFLVSGGVDTNLVFSKYPPQTVVKFSPFSELSYSSVAAEASLLLLRYHAELQVWRLGKTNAVSECQDESLQLTLSPIQVASVHSRSGQQIICSAISSDGRWLAYSTASELKLYNLNTESGTPYLQRVKSLPKSLKAAAHCLVFKPSESQLIISTAEGTVKILDCDLILPKQLAISEDLSDHNGRKHLLTVCKDFIASGDHNGNVTIYNANNLEIYSHLPHYKFQPTALQFDRAGENLIVVYSDRKLVEYSLKAKAFSSWSRQNCIAKEKLVTNSYYPIRGISFAPDCDAILLHDENAIYIIDRSEKDQSLRKRSKHFDSSVVQEEENFRISQQYKHLLSFQELKDDQMVVVEVPPDFILQSLPPALRRKKFGV